jgi:hypothetical protein
VSGFNYDADDTPDEVVRGVAADIGGRGLRPLTPDEIAEREEWRREYLARQEQERLAAEEYRLAQEREREAVAQREAAIASQRAGEKARAERQQQFDRELRRRDMLDLRMAAARADTFQRNVENAHRNALAYQHRQTLLNELEQMISPPAVPEPTAVVVESDEPGSHFGERGFNPDAWMRRRYPWWRR